MGPRAIAQILVLCSVHAIRVPVDWSDSSAVSSGSFNRDAETFSDTEIVSEPPKIPIPVEYFQYPANKPQFAVDVAAYHGVQNPENHYTAYPIRPYTGKERPALGQHKILEERNPVFQQFQQFTKINDDDKSYVSPGSSDYTVFHPYKDEEPALQELYKDPVLDKIRNDILNSQNRLQEYEKEAGEPDIQENEYLESPEQTDRKKVPHKNVPVPYEIHRPQKKPVYYRPSPYTSRDHYLNRRFRHPWNQHNAKIRPMHYRPLKNHIHQLRHNHAIKFDDEHNEYPQIPTHEYISEKPDGYDIYERGKSKYVALRNNVDESINNAVKQNKPATFQRLELQNNGDTMETISEDDDFIPIKNYAQVRKTETTKHLPKTAAFEDAENFDEIKNAPRLREAIKSTKAQTVYTEEGYEDAAYDHEGEEKHAAENEAHGGHLTEKEISGGKYKAPSVSQNYQDATGNEHRDQILDGKKWKNNDKNETEEVEEEDYSEDETERSIESEVYDDVNGGRDKRQHESSENHERSVEEDDGGDESQEVTVERNKRENKSENSTLGENAKINISSSDHALDKRATEFKIPFVNLNSTFLSAEELFKKKKLKTHPKKGSINEKYPYYFKKLKKVSRDSPLRYAENLNFIPNKTRGGTEFYDSRSKILECPEVDEEVDALPEKFKKEGHPDENDDSDENGDSANTNSKADFSQIKKNRRLKGLGDKIDCFKAKFFGENPLDSPFFKEEIISNPEPITEPNTPTFRILPKERFTQSSFLDNPFNVSDEFKQKAKIDASHLFDTLNGKQKDLQKSLQSNNQELPSTLLSPYGSLLIGNTQSLKQADVYTDILENIKNNLRQPVLGDENQVEKQPIQLNTIKMPPSNLTYELHQNEENVTTSPNVRKKRATQFIYEPYKIIKDNQFQESKKTTTTGNASPLIKQLQSSKVIERVAKSSEEKDQPVKRNITGRRYKDIGSKDREKNAAPERSEFEASFVDVNVDKRRGEPRYEIRLPNHKPHYTPVENKKSMSVRDYEAQTNKTLEKTDRQEANQSDSKSFLVAQKVRRPTDSPFFDISRFIPKKIDIQKSASNPVKKVIQKPTNVSNKQKEVQETKMDTKDAEDYDEYDSQEVTTTTSTIKPSFRRRIHRTTTTTPNPDEEEEPELPKLRLITRFNTTPVPPQDNTKVKQKIEKDSEKNYKEDVEPVSPKYREKKKKSSKSTLVTDTKTYGDGDDDMMKDEVDSMIGVQQNMEEYTPQYEKEMESKGKSTPISLTSSEEIEDDEEDSDEDDDDDDEEFSDEDEEDNSDEESSSVSASSETDQEVTTHEPTKRTLTRTTEAPISTTEARSAKLELKPVVHKKKIEIHTEIPMNKSSPHMTQFKQDIQELEIIKEMPLKIRQPQRIPQRRPQKNVEVLDLYKDENLAKEINKLKAVEVFKQNLDLVTGPKHGGNYRSAPLAKLPESSLSNQPRHSANLELQKDPDTSQSKNEKLVELTEMLPARRHHDRNYNSRTRNTGRSAKLELGDSETDKKRMHGGNLKTIQDKQIRRGGRNKNAKLIELDDEEDDEDSTDEERGDNVKSYENPKSSHRSLHGGNYRSAKLKHIDKETTTRDDISDITTNPRSKAAVLLNSFVQAIPHLTTTPGYILDPSKRRYYYVDAKR